MKISEKLIAYQRLDRADFSMLFNNSAKTADYTELRNKAQRLNILGLGDVGRTLALGLKIINSKSIAEIGIYDLNLQQIQRVELELAQSLSLGREEIKVRALSPEQLFDCDIFVFTASVAVPAVGSDVKDVRMAQLEKNSAILKEYVEMAKKADFKGRFFIVSDPVDLLAKVAAKHAEAIAYHSLRPEKIIGFGLGVMYARALYYAEQMKLTEFASNGRVYGPHGQDLVVINDILAYDQELSLALTAKTVNANMAIRELGFKPYLAPAISSGAFTISNLLEGKWQYSAINFGDIYLGIKNKRVKEGIVIESIPENPLIAQRLEAMGSSLESIYADFTA